jgi:hypothetical protein
LASRHKFSEVAQNDIFNTILMFCPIINKLPKTFYKLMKQSIERDFEFNTKEFCQSCNKELNNKQICTNGSCLNSSIKQSSYDCFTCINIDKQIQQIVSRHFDIILNYKSSNRKFKDILDGENYKNKCLQENTLNLITYTDGFQVTNNSSIEMWPVICSIIEFPPIIRNSLKNKIIFGLWCGKSKPTSDILFEQFSNQMLDLMQKGIDVVVNGKNVKFVINMYGFISDSPARSLSIKINQHNGYSSCPFCEIEGTLSHVILF